GGLIYLAAVCPSGTVLSYELHRLAGAEDKTLLAGQTLDEIGAVAATDEGLVLIRSRQADGRGRAGWLRGPQPVTAGASEIWLYDPASNGRLKLVSIVDAVTAIR
ncbi:MAG TPA: hypothetical protein VGE07_15950, partial [Herpetosiphonaceae bacterium]